MSRTLRFSRFSRFSVLVSRLVVLGLGVGLLASCGGGGDASGPWPGAPVVLISIDTLRSDRLPAYGFDGVETPAIDAIADESILFESAWSHYPLTLPSHASILTGLLPPEHGVRDNVGYRLDTEAHPYLPRLLAAAGHPTGAAVSAFVLEGRHTGLAEGFDLYDDGIESGSARSLGGVQRSGDESRARLTGWIEEQLAAGSDGAGNGNGDAPAPFFAFLHLYEPHTPWTPPEPFASRYDDPYVGEVAAADAVVGRFRDDLVRLGVWDDALVIVLSDHGEGLGDHGEREHGILLYREALQVPLLVKLPEGARGGTRVETGAQLADVMPTVLDALGLPVPDGLTGRSLLAVAAGEVEERPLYAETWYPRLHLGWSELTSVVEGPWHYIEGPEPELYDWRADPGETTDVLAEERRTYARLRDALEGFEAPLEGPGEVDAETAERLASLGYLASSAPLAEGPLPDPKSRIHLLEDLGRARRLIEEGSAERAVEILAPMVEDNPRMQDAWSALALAERSRGRLAAASEAYRRAIEAVGPEAGLLLGRSAVLLSLGRLTEAEEHARLALEADPVPARLRLAEVALARRDLETAEEEARAAYEERGNRAAPAIRLAEVLARRGELEEARRILAVAEEELAGRTSQETLPGFHFVRGDILAREGRAEEARAQLLEEIRLYPESLDAHASLAFLLAFQGRGDAAAATLARMVEASGTPAAYARAVETLRLLGDGGQAERLLSFARQRFPGSEQLDRLAAEEGVAGAA